LIKSGEGEAVEVMGAGFAGGGIAAAGVERTLQAAVGGFIFALDGCRTAWRVIGR